MAQNSVSLPEGMSIRQAGLDDLDALVSIGIASMPLDPQWDYQFPRRLEFPEDHRARTTDRWREFFHADPNGPEVSVYFIEYQPKGDARAAKPLPIAFSVWNFPRSNTEASGSGGMNQASALQDSSSSSAPAVDKWRDMNAKHRATFVQALDSARDEKFVSRYGERRAYLKILGTHPDYHRMGAASALLRDGIQRARSRDLPVNLFASPMGKPLYSRFGFEDVGYVRIQADGEDESVGLVAMVLEGETK